MKLLPFCQSPDPKKIVEDPSGSGTGVFAILAENLDEREGHRIPASGDASPTPLKRSPSQGDRSWYGKIQALDSGAKSASFAGRKGMLRLQM